jgi:hypothetical protein
VCWITDIVRNCSNLPQLLEETDYWLIDLYSTQANETYKVSWEQTRFIALVTAQVQSTKRIKPKDIMGFPWDSEQDKGKHKNKTQPIDEAKRQELMSKMKQYEQSVPQSPNSLTD